MSVYMANKKQILVPGARFAPFAPQSLAYPSPPD
jgi:hypothetical protein